MTYKFENISSCRIAFARGLGPYGADNYKTMEKIKLFAKSNDLFGDNSVILGIAQDNPEHTKPEDCRYDACLVVSDDFHTSAKGINLGKIQSGKYAVFTIIHTAEEVKKAWTEIFHELARNGNQIDFTKPVIERYATKMVQDNKCEICIPVQNS